MWGIERLYLHNRGLRNQTVNTNSLPEWIAFYYNPLGFYGVWGSAFPTASILFFSIVARLGSAIDLFWYQHKLELSLDTRVSLKKTIRTNQLIIGFGFVGSAVRLQNSI